MAARTRATGHGAIPAIHQIVVRSGLVRGIDEGLELLKIHRPYHESDHVLNIAYNALCGGRVLEDIELRRNDEAFLARVLGSEAPQVVDHDLWSGFVAREGALCRSPRLEVVIGWVATPVCAGVVSFLIYRLIVAIQAC